ncbi:MAG: polysaccharide export protein, partial [Bacteroidales bacterium]|nr:polysaccharide export protein [Bacteroidales bacterium]MDY5227276.1 polysaccharide export protein [Sodaliphilus sp.]
DLANADQLYTSPVFYLQQHDMIYVEPNTRRAKEATELGISFSNPSLWLSAASLLTTISVLIFKN